MQALRWHKQYTPVPNAQPHARPQLRPWSQFHSHISRCGNEQVSCVPIHNLHHRKCAFHSCARVVSWHLRMKFSINNGCWAWKGFPSHPPQLKPHRKPTNSTSSRAMSMMKRQWRFRTLLQPFTSTWTCRPESSRSKACDTSFMKLMQRMALIQRLLFHHNVAYSTGRTCTTAVKSVVTLLATFYILDNQPRKANGAARRVSRWSREQETALQVFEHSPPVHHQCAAVDVWLNPLPLHQQRIWKVVVGARLLCPAITTKRPLHCSHEQSDSSRLPKSSSKPWECIISGSPCNFFNIKAGRCLRHSVVPVHQDASLTFWYMYICIKELFLENHDFFTLIRDQSLQISSSHNRVLAVLPSWLIFLAMKLC